MTAKWFFVGLFAATALSLYAQPPIPSQQGQNPPPIVSMSSGSSASSGGITIGTTTITSGTSTRVLFDDAATVGEDAGFTYAKTTDTLTIGTASATTGIIAYKGTTSGVVSTSVADAAGTYTLKWPTSIGTASFAMITDGTNQTSFVTGQSIAGLTTASTPQFERVGLGVTANATSALTFVAANGPIWNTAGNASSRQFWMTNDVAGFGEFGITTESTKNRSTFDTYPFVIKADFSVWMGGTAAYTTPVLKVGTAGTSLETGPLTVRTTFGFSGTTALAVANVGANSCGTTAATIAGNDNAFAITVGATAGTQCRVTFTRTAPVRWYCAPNDETTAGAGARFVPVSTTTGDFIGTFTAGDVVSAICVPR